MMETNEILNNIRSKLDKILKTNFTNRYRQKIDTYPDRWNFCCPICGDSVNDNRKKRGNLYLNSMSYHCYNCGCHYGINSFLRQFNEELSEEDKVFVHDIQQNSKKFERRYHNGAKSTSLTYKILDQLAVPKNIFFKVNKLVSPYKNKFASDYLNLRKIDIRKWKYFAYNEITKELYILNINQNDRIIGYQIRQLDPKSRKPRYLTKSISKMYYDMFGKSLEDIVSRLLSNVENSKKFIDEEDGIENIVAHLDKLSGLFNIMNIDLLLQLTIVEGPIDSLMLDNSIALQGATKMNNYFDNVDNVRYLFDNDTVGKKHSIDKIKSHKQVFLWDLYLNKIKCNDKIKDINDLAKKDKLKMDIFNGCFSDNEFDIIMI